MRTIETTATITAEGKLTVEVPSDLPPGEHKVVLVIEEPSVQMEPRAPLKLATYPLGLASDTLTFRREELYGDDGR